MVEKRKVDQVGATMHWIDATEELHELIKPAFTPVFPRAKQSNHASELTGCKRRRFWEWTGKKGDTELPMHTNIIFAMGNAMEEMLLNIFKGARIYQGTQVRVHFPDLNIGGYIDCVLIMPDGRLMPVEIKTASDASFSGRRHYKCPECGAKVSWNSKTCVKCESVFPAAEVVHLFRGKKDGPDPGHYTQLMAYLMGSEFAWTNPVTGELQTKFADGRLLYMNKNLGKTADIIWFEVRPDKKWWKKIVADVKLLNKYLKNNEVPPRDFSATFKENGALDSYASDFQCRYCPYVGESKDTSPCYSGD